LTNGNLTATHSNTTAGSGARAALTLSSDKYYFEITLNVGSGAQDSLGLLTTAGTYFDPPGTNAAAVHRGTGNIYGNNILSAKTLGLVSNGTLIGVAVDLTARLVWFRKGAAGNWNGDVAANPNTGANGVVIAAAVAFGPFVGFSGSGTSLNDAYTANFGATAFSGAVPTGFISGWGT
jgi:hypothetical protein